MSENARAEEYCQATVTDEFGNEVPVNPQPDPVKGAVQMAVGAVIAAAGVSKREFLERRVSTILENYMENRKSYAATEQTLNDV